MSKCMLMSAHLLCFMDVAHPQVVVYNYSLLH